jgi:hypothetical protein
LAQQEDSRVEPHIFSITFRENHAIEYRADAHSCGWTMRLTLDSSSEYKAVCLTVGTQKFCGKS